MKVLWILLCVAFASGFYIDNNETHGEKIIGGNPVRIDFLPYQASLHWLAMAHICGATIIHAFWVITAAHCVINKSHISVRTGSGLTRTLGNVHAVEKIISHADFDANAKNNNDIALIMLKEPIQFDHKQQAIAIAKPYDVPREGQLMRISGFGRTGSHMRESEFLKEAYVPVVNQEFCERTYYSSDPITDNMFCAGNGTADMGFGDSGGPGVIHGKLYGIISSNTRSASRLFPGVYTRVHKYYPWIVEETGHIL